MDTNEDKQWASKYLLDPLTAPGPSEETGPGTHYNSTFAMSNKTPASPDSPRRHNTVGHSHSRSKSGASANAYPSPPMSASPRRERFPDYRQEAFNGDSQPSRRSADQNRPDTGFSSAGRRRGSSLNERFPGDKSHHPLDMLRREAKVADRSPHLRKGRIPGPDIVDSLDTVGGAYHHEGPFDAALLARNQSFNSSPLEAVKSSNEEALKATPPENIKDSIERHRPLDGVAMYAPGQRDFSGRLYQYEEGTDLMRDTGDNDYKRWPGVDYLPDDLKGKGEPSYSLEKALKEHKTHRRVLSDGNSGIEMTDRPRSAGRTTGNDVDDGTYAEMETRVRRSSSMRDGLKRRIGSLRRRSKDLA